MEPSHTQEEQPAASGNRRFVAMVSVAIVCLLIGLVIRYVAWQVADPSKIDPAPLPRQGRNAPFITTPDPVVEKMVELAAISEEELVYDLGCGDGRMVITAALKTGCQGVGFDIDPERVAEARKNATENGVADRVAIEEQDVFTLDLSEADVALVYLLPWMMNKLVPEFEKMKPGSRIVAHDFWIDGVQPDQCIEVPVSESKAHGIYLYTLPLTIDPAMEKGKPPRPTGPSASVDH